MALGDWRPGADGQPFAALVAAARAEGIGRLNVEAAASDDLAAAELMANGLRPGAIFAARDVAVPDAAARRVDARRRDAAGIRPATAGDRAALSALAREEALFQAANTTAGTSLHQPPALFDGIVDGWLLDPGTAVFMAEAADGRGGPAGMVVVQDVAASAAERALGLPERHGYLSVLSVTASARGRGIGGALADRAMEWLSAAGLSRVALHYIADNPASAPFWAGRGFAPLVVSYSRSCSDRDQE
ncbi:GNAT family N-acetyltransferase [Microterricola viridarii]|uniref:N-acetyltransferase domain-containing protein n=1 Tax=Microterricola viridarii TaxID=412690 RepID=A0A109QX51_9MICO|nr:GNAT family N-acetyltransferase [Microterricola viridarii]AMB59360.1 hypothetical protein AWU67_11360 [Microterricola viridarii]